MRLFVAVEIGEALSASAAGLSRQLQQRAARAKHAKITWVPADRLHLTVRFIGEVDDATAEVIRDTLTPPLHVRPFDLTLSGAGSFPKSGTPRVLWIGVTGGGEQLRAVEQEITSRLTPLGVGQEARPYTPHLTLARVREGDGLRSQTLLDGLSDHKIGTARIDAITLFQSKLSPKGPTYTPLLRIPCASSSPS